MATSSRSPVAVRVGQMMTGLGVGCGVGIGVGYPIALGSVPIVGDLLSATSSAGSRAFGGFGHQAFRLLGRFGVKNLKAGAGCGFGIGHGFGAGSLLMAWVSNPFLGIALKPGVSRQIVLSFQEGLLAVGNKLCKFLPASEGGTSQVSNDLHPKGLTEAASKVPSAGILDLETSSNKGEHPNHGHDGSTVGLEPNVSTISSSRREVHDLQQQNDILRALLRHQELIEDLRMQNVSILRVLPEMVDVRGAVQEDVNKRIEAALLSKSRRRKEMLHAMHSRSPYPDPTCFDCRRKSRRRE